MALTAAPTGQDVADFLGRGDPETVALAGQHVEVITAMARAYTRGAGFVDTQVQEEIAAVVTTATARLMGNPEQTNYRVGSISYQSHFVGWSLAETITLNRYRRRAQ